jgi:hypothetical protein
MIETNRTAIITQTKVSSISNLNGICVAHNVATEAMLLPPFLQRLLIW